MPEHYPVLLSESLEFLNIRPDGKYLDCTAGLGGHTRAIASRLSEAGLVIANDRDPQSLEMARANTKEFWDRIDFQHSAFSELNHSGLDGILADLGVSRFQLTDPERGFSFLSDGPLDMRLDQTRGVTAADLVNFSAEKQIADWLYQLGEERRARKITGALIRGRPVRSTRHLADIVERAVPRTGPIHPATRTFMALRMVVNQELEELDALLERAPLMVRPGGRIVIISFHSLEDRKVKNSFRELARSGRAVLLTKKPVVPGERELRENPPSRSARLRAVEMVSATNGGQPGLNSADQGEEEE
ncbi:MAG TPA: 16S rRNA (cytosine(1402)-N(4))-methyltransferase RsmH [Bryobacteraceae bacterium]|nr:16S rRNA (cytosine(1402)-N(4))-methyltransferase RsmH [Bryobacteraceae bacterium]